MLALYDVCISLFLSRAGVPYQQDGPGLHGECGGR
jgi:hypothetical protein